MEKEPASTCNGKGGMVLYHNTRINTSFKPPIRISPIRFAVLRRNDLSSNAWRVWTEKSGEAYVACHDHMKDLKVSLHKSGKHHIAFTTESGLEMRKGSRFWDQWHEPKYYDGSRVVPTFNLYFPSWALSLTPETRLANAKVWETNQIFVEAAEEPMATIVSLVITDENQKMTFSTNGDALSFPIAVLPTMARKKLWVIAGYGPEGNMKELAEKGIANAPIDSNAIKRLRDFPSGHILGMCVTGPTTDGGTYCMPFTASMRWGHPERGSDSLKG